MARRTAGSPPMAVRTKLTVIMENTNSHGRSGLTKRCPRLRDHISSRKQMLNPIWPRNITSHSSTAPISTPDAVATQLECSMKKFDTNPQMSSGRPASRRARSASARSPAADRVAQHHRPDPAQGERQAPFQPERLVGARRPRSSVCLRYPFGVCPVRLKMAPACARGRCPGTLPPDPVGYTGR